MTEPISAEAQWKRWLDRYTWHLDQAPLLLDEMRKAAIPLAAAVYDRVIVDTSEDGAPLPFREDAIDDADDLWAALIQYAENAQEVLMHRDPLVLAPLPRGRVWRVRSDVAGVRASANVHAEAHAVVAWLVDQVEWIATHDELAESEDFLFGRIRSARAKYSAAPVKRRARPRSCETCGECAVVVAWANDVDGEPMQIGRCKVCGQTYSEAG